MFVSRWPVRLLAFGERWLLYPSTLLGITSVCWNLCVDRLLGLTTDGPILVLVFSLTLITYNRDRLSDSEGVADTINTRRRTRWVVRSRAGLRAFLFALATLSFGIVLFRPRTLPPILGGLGFALTYSNRWLPGGLALRQLPGVKVPYVATLWTLLTVGVPVAAAGAGVDLRTALVALAIFFSAAALVNLNDLRDISGDRVAGTLTVPVLLGEGLARLFSIALALFATAFALALHHPTLWLVGLYIAGLTLTYRPEADRTFRWLIEGVGLLTVTLVFLAGS